MHLCSSSLRLGFSLSGGSEPWGWRSLGNKEFLSEWNQMPKVRFSHHQKIAEGPPFLPQWQNQAGLGSLCQRGGSGQ